MLFENEYTDLLIFNFHNEVLMRNVGFSIFLCRIRTIFASSTTHCVGINFWTL